MKRHVCTIAVLIPLGLAIGIGCRSMYLQPDGDDPSSFLRSGRTASFFEAIQIDPRAEDSAGPQFAAIGDFNNDGRLDLATGWNESQPIQIHLQRATADGSVTFATVPIGGTTPIARIAGLRVADLDSDGFDDIVVLVKDTGLVARCDVSRPECDVTDNGGVIENALAGMVVILFNPRDVENLPWLAAPMPQSALAGKDEGDAPELGGYADIAVGDIDGINGPDIVVTLNSAEGDPNTETLINTVDFYPNPGGGTARNPEGWSRRVIYGDLPMVSACRITDVDGDGDNDVIVTYPTAKSSNIRWLPNPLSLGGAANVYDVWPNFAPVGQVASEANAIEVGDIDGDGAEDLLVRSTAGKVVQWFKKPNSPSQTYVRNPWQVFTIAEFADRRPQAIALGDLTGDGRLNAAIAAQGAVAWFGQYNPNDPEGVYDLWRETMIIDDSPEVTNATTGGLAGLITDPNANPEATGETFVNTLLIADFDGDGYADIVATLDRSKLSGLSNDALVLFRNTRGD